MEKGIRKTPIREDKVFHSIQPKFQGESIVKVFSLCYLSSRHNTAFCLSNPFVFYAICCTESTYSHTENLLWNIYLYCGNTIKQQEKERK